MTGHAVAPDGTDALRLLTTAVAVHLLLTLAHTAAHAAIPVPVADWQLGYASVALFAAPLAGVWLGRRGQYRAGAALILAAGLAGLAFEGAFHFVVAGPDHASSVADGASLFASTAALTTASDALLAVAGGVALRRHAQGSATTSRMDSTT